MARTRHESYLNIWGRAREGCHTGFAVKYDPGNRSGMPGGRNSQCAKSTAARNFFEARRGGSAEAATSTLNGKLETNSRLSNRLGKEAPLRGSGWGKVHAGGRKTRGEKLKDLSGELSKKEEGKKDKNHNGCKVLEPRRKRTCQTYFQRSIL